jgi:hypothetical protein
MNIFGVCCIYKAPLLLGWSSSQCSQNKMKSEPTSIANAYVHKVLTALTQESRVSTFNFTI